jgi:ATP-dependent DNA helicase RecG
MTSTPDVTKLLTGGRPNTVLLEGSVSPSDLARYAIGLANAKGGTLVVGVGPEGVLEGATDLHPLQLTHALYELTQGRLTVNCSQSVLEGKALLVVSVPRSQTVLATPTGEVITWNGARLEPLEAASLEPAPELDFTATVPPTSSLSDLDPLEVHRLRSVLESRRGADLAQLPDLDLLRALGVLEGDQPNLAGILLAGTARALKRYVPQAEIDYYHHATGDLEFEFRETLQKPLPAVLERLRELIQARNRYETLQVGLFRIEVWDFDEVVYREAILNALVHRDYTSRDTVQLHHFPSHLEITNPGGFAGGVSEENILRHAPKRRNPVLAEALARLGYIERAGVGVDRMYRLMLRHGKEPPEYTSYPDSVQLTLHNPAFDEGFARFVARKQEEMGQLSLDTLIVLTHLKREREANRDAMGRALQLPNDRVVRALRPLEDANLIARAHHGTGPDLWVLSDETLLAIGSDAQVRVRQAVPPAARSSLPLSAGVQRLGAARDSSRVGGPALSRVEMRTQLRESVRELARRHGSIANRDVRAAFDLSLSQASFLLRTMTQAGMLERFGETPRATRYAPPVTTGAG